MHVYCNPNGAFPRAFLAVTKCNKLFSSARPPAQVAAITYPQPEEEPQCLLVSVGMCGQEVRMAGM